MGLKNMKRLGKSHILYFPNHCIVKWMLETEKKTMTKITGDSLCTHI